MKSIPLGASFMRHQHENTALVDCLISAHNVLKDRPKQHLDYVHGLVSDSRQCTPCQYLVVGQIWILKRIVKSWL